MFKRNESHKQSGSFSTTLTLNAEKQARLSNSSGGFFYRHIFCNIEEEDFAVLYSGKYSAPNAPINCMLAALIWQHKHWRVPKDIAQLITNFK